MYRAGSAGQQLPRHPGASRCDAEPACERQGQAGAGRDGTRDTDHVAGLQRQAGVRHQLLDGDVLGVEHMIGAGPLVQLQLLGEDLTLHVEGGQCLVQPARQPPGPLPQEGHHRRDQRHPHAEGVDGHSDGQREGDLLDGADALGHEEREDREHDHGSGDDDRT